MFFCNDEDARNRLGPARPVKFDKSFARPIVFEGAYAISDTEIKESTTVKSTRLSMISLVEQ